MEEGGDEFACEESTLGRRCWWRCEVKNVHLGGLVGYSVGSRQQSATTSLSQQLQASRNGVLGRTIREMHLQLEQSSFPYRSILPGDRTIPLLQIESALCCLHRSSDESERVVFAPILAIGRMQSSVMRLFPCQRAVGVVVPLFCESCSA